MLTQLHGSTKNMLPDLNTARIYVELIGNPGSLWQPVASPTRMGKTLEILGYPVEIKRNLMEILGNPMQI